MQNYRKQIGYASEDIVKEHYCALGYVCVAQNYTIPGGEIDLIMENTAVRVFVEVKNVSHTDDIHDYITPKKMTTLQKTIAIYDWKFPSDQRTQLDVVFVSQGKILEQYCDVTV